MCLEQKEQRSDRLRSVFATRRLNLDWLAWQATHSFLTRKAQAEAAQLLTCIVAKRISAVALTGAACSSATNQRNTSTNPRIAEMESWLDLTWLGLALCIGLPTVCFTLDFRNTILNQESRSKNQESWFAILILITSLAHLHFTDLAWHSGLRLPLINHFDLVCERARTRTRTRN